jgi:hypothetical protein
MPRANEQLRVAFGLSWRSPALTIAELPELPIDRSLANVATIDITPEDPELWPGIPPSPLDTPFLKMGRGDLRLKVEGIGHYRVTSGEHIAWHREHQGVTDQDLSTFLLGPPVAALLIQRGMVVLHGNALEKGGLAVACMGHSGAGKSTLAYALMQQGWRLLADDLVTITPDGLVLPGIPRIKLWHDAAKGFGLDPTQLTPVRQGMHKYLLMGDTLDRATEPVPLQALYLIQQRHSDIPDSVPSSVTRITSQKVATVQLRNQVYRPRFVRGLGQEGPNFMALARLQGLVPLASLPLPAGITAMRDWLEQQDLLQGAAIAEGQGPALQEDRVAT